MKMSNMELIPNDLCGLCHGNHVQFLNSLTLCRWNKWRLLSGYLVEVGSCGNGGHTGVSYWETSRPNACMLPVICNSRNFSSLFSGVQYLCTPNCILVCVLSLLQKWFYVQLSLSQIEVFILPLLLQWMLTSKLSYSLSVNTV